MVKKDRPYKKVKIGKRTKKFDTAWDYFMWKYGFRLFAVLAGIFLILISAVIYVAITGDMATVTAVIDSVIVLFAFIGSFIFLLGVYTDFDTNTYALIGIVEMILVFLWFSVFSPSNRKKELG